MIQEQIKSIKSPLKAISIYRLILGIIFCGFSILNWFRFSNVSNTENAHLLHIILAVMFLILAVYNILKWLKTFRKITLTPNIPFGFRDSKMVYRSMEAAYNYTFTAPQNALKWMYDLLGEDILYMKPSERKATQNLLNSVVLSFLLIVGIVALNILKPDFTIELADVSYQLHINNIFFVVFIFSMFTVITVCIISITELFPPAPPPSDVSETIETIEGGGDPNAYSTRIEKTLLDYRYNKFPNRVSKEGFKKMEDISINETGSFKANLTIETHPIIKEKPDVKNVSYLLVCGVIFVFASCLLLLPVSFQSFNLFLEDTMIDDIIAALALFSFGMYFIVSAEDIANVFEYESYFFFLKLEGTIGKAEVSAGKSLADSFESKNTVLRSDAQVKMYSAKLTSRNADVFDTRELVSMTQDSIIEKMKLGIAETLQSICNEGITVKGVSINSESLNEMVKANLFVQKARNESLSELETNSINELSLTQQTQRISAGNENKECPMCAETVKFNAKICRFCRHTFE